MKFIHADITKFKADCIINPSNGLGVMHKGVSKMLYREGGPEVQNSAKEACFVNGLYKAGQAYMGKPGFLAQRGIKAICHAVTVYRHPEKTKIENMEKAIENSLILIRENGYKSVSIPALGIEPRNIDSIMCSKAMLKVLNSNGVGLDINIIDTNREFIECCVAYYEKWMIPNI